MAGPSADRSFERLYKKHVSDVYRYASAVLSNSTDAEDVAQTVFLNAYRAFQAGERPDQPLNWLIAITHNVCRQRFRDGSRRPREVVLDDGVVTLPVEEQDERYRREDIVRALSQLSLNQRAALALRELEGRSYGEIASILGMTTSAVETLLFRARRAFREQLEGSLTCNEAERAISLQLDGMLERAQRGGLRAHLRSCSDCAALARRFRAQRSALRGIGLVPLPSSLAGSFGGGGGAVIGTALGVKALAFGTAALVAAGVGTTELVLHSRSKRAPAPRAQQQGAAVDAELASAQATTASSGPSKPVGPAVVRSAHTKTPATHRRNAVTHTNAIGRSGSPSVGTPTGSTAAGALATASIETPSQETGVREDTAVRQRPQLSGGGAPPKQTHGVTTRNEHRPAQPGRPTDPSSAPASNGRGHDPQTPDHPSADSHPGAGDHPGGAPPSQPESAPPGQEQQPTVPDVTVPSTPGPPDVTPAVDPPVNPPDPPGKSKNVVPPIHRP